MTTDTRQSGVVVWKFALRPWSAFLDMPKGARLIHAGAQGEDVCVWAECDPEAAKVPRYVIAVPTGHPVPEFATTFVGTAQMADGLVFHVYDGGERVAR